MTHTFLRQSDRKHVSTQYISGEHLNVILFRILIIVSPISSVEMNLHQISG